MHGIVRNTMLSATHKTRRPEQGNTAVPPVAKAENADGQYSFLSCMFSSPELEPSPEAAQPAQARGTPGVLEILEVIAHAGPCERQVGPLQSPNICSPTLHTLFFSLPW